MEMFLVKDANFRLDEIRGQEETEIRWQKPTDIISRLREAIPWCDDPEPVAEVVERETPGMTDKEVHEFVALHDEQETIRKEKREQEMNKHG